MGSRQSQTINALVSCSCTCRALYVWLCAKDLRALQFEESAVLPGSPEELLMALARHTHSPPAPNPSPSTEAPPDSDAQSSPAADQSNLKAAIVPPLITSSSGPVVVTNGTSGTQTLSRSTSTSTPATSRPNPKPLMADASYATAYAALARFAGLECAVVEGFVKGFRYEPGDSVRDESGTLIVNHAWNAVRVDGQWRLLDACAGARYFQVSFSNEFKFYLYGVYSKAVLIL